jgi:hypothetical protein
LRPDRADGQSGEDNTDAEAGSGKRIQGHNKLSDVFGR